MPYRGRIWRIVEAQHKVSSARLTDGLEEQQMLERLVEEVKPPLPSSCKNLHYLLATPFRYRPYPNGSRFRRADQEDGVFYASEHIETAVAETATYRARFFRASIDAILPATAVLLTAFAIDCATDRAIDLTMPPLSDFGFWTDPDFYGPCQLLADEARAKEIDLLRYESVRDPAHRANVALLSSTAFADTQPDMSSVQTWHLLIQQGSVRAWREFPANLQLEFSIDRLLDPYPGRSPPT